MMWEIQRLANQVDTDERGFGKRLRFCLSCGGPHLKECEREFDPQGRRIQGKEFWCSLCGFSFNVRASIEWNLALRMFREHRQMRNGVRFEEKHIAPETAKAWKLKYERPVFRPTSTWSLSDKLKAALRF